MRRFVATLGLLSILLLLSALGVQTANAVTITFDEFAADNSNGGIPASRYAFLGVTFSTTDDGTTWGGLSMGDPGNWDLEGTNGPIFSGYNGSSYAATLFSATISSFSLDVSRSNGSSVGNTFTLEGYFNNILVDSVLVALGPINQWSSVSLTGTFDEVRWSGAGAGFHPFGVDNIQFVPEPSTAALLATGLAGLALRRRKA